MASTLDNMSARYIDPKLKDATERIPSLIISADSHIDEPLDLWSKLPINLKCSVYSRAFFIFLRAQYLKNTLHLVTIFS